MAGLADDLFLAGDFGNALLVLQELQRAGAGRVAAPAARAALTSVADSAALREAAGLLGELDESSVTTFAACCQAIGPGAVRALYPALQSETETPASQRARAVVLQYGATAAPHLAALGDDPRWFVQRNAAQLLGATRSAEAVPPLLALLRKQDARVLRYAVTALAGIDDPSAARAVQTALRAATGASRSTVIEALVAERDPRVVPMLSRILAEIDPFGPDHEVLLDTLAAVRQLADERSVDPVVAVMRRKKLFARRKAKAFKTASVTALVAIGSPTATRALDDAARAGDRVLKRVIRDVTS
jgi:HEAT repeat protein